MTRILVIDNYDSFVYTIVSYLRELGAHVQVVRNDQFDGAAGDFDGVLISPGPGAPADAGQSLDVIRQCADGRVPMLGVCLGHQALAEFYGGVVAHAPALRHGKTSPITHDGTGVLAGQPSPFAATRYHSLAIVDGTLPDVLEATAWTDGVIMAVRHRELPLHGVQFHPESVLTEGGYRILGNWLEMCGLAGAAAAGATRAPLIASVPA